jgi:CRP/FNR family cyclic AMP-dependent transcriptional regulator
MWRWLKNYWFDPEFNRRRKFLQRISFFKSVPRHEFGRLFQTLVVRDYRPGEVLFKEGDVGRALFIMESGRIEIFRLNQRNDLQRVSLMGPGDYFGEMSLLDDLPRVAGARALEDSRVFLLYKTELDMLLERAPKLGGAIMGHLAELLAARLRMMMDRSRTDTQPVGQANVPYIEEAV